MLVLVQVCVAADDESIAADYMYWTFYKGAQHKEEIIPCTALSLCVLQQKSLCNIELSVSMGRMLLIFC